MAERPLKRADARDWKGMISAADPHDLPPDALQVLENMQILNRGELLGRAGYRRLGFLTGDTSNPSPSPVVSMVNFQTPLNEFCVYATESGQIKAGMLGCLLIALVLSSPSQAAGRPCWEEQVLRRPTEPQASLEGGFTDPAPLTPHNHRKRLAPNRDEAVGPFVPVLLPPRGPAAIFRGVRSIVVHPVNRVLGRRTRSHVGVKGLEGIQPALAHGDPAAAVKMKVAVVGIEAPLLHGRPNAVLRGGGSPSGMPMRGHDLSMQATAAPLPAAPQVGTASWALSTAVALAAPANVPTQLGVAADDLESAKSLSDQVDQPRHLRAPRVNHMVIAQSPQKHKVV